MSKLISAGALGLALATAAPASANIVYHFQQADAFPTTLRFSAKIEVSDGLAAGWDLGDGGGGYGYFGHTLHLPHDHGVLFLDFRAQQGPKIFEVTTGYSGNDYNWFQPIRWSTLALPSWLIAISGGPDGVTGSFKFLAENDTILMPDDMQHGVFDTDDPDGNPCNATNTCTFSGIWTVSHVDAPEPASLALLGAGLLGLVVGRRRA